MNERQIIDHIAALAGPADARLLKGIGDDCAVIVRNEASVWLLTMDTLIESVHFDRRFHPPDKLGRKAVSVNVSDIAAMGGTPVFVLFSAGLPPDFDQDWFTAFSRGMAEACREYGCTIIGGDTVASPAGFNFSLTLIGEAAAGRVLYRSGARPGDTVWVSGELGWAAAGLALLSANLAPDNREFDRFRERHWNPTARVDLGRRLAREELAHAMMDCSDGLATDLAHLCAQSGVGARIEAACLPGPASLAEAARLAGADPVAWAIAGGEDFELLFTADPAAEERLGQLGRDMGLALTPVGRINASEGVSLIKRRPDGGEEVVSVSFQGYDHFRKDSGQ